MDAHKLYMAYICASKAAERLHAAHVYNGVECGVSAANSINLAREELVNLAEALGYRVEKIEADAEAK